MAAAVPTSPAVHSQLPRSAPTASQGHRGEEEYKENARRRPPDNVSIPPSAQIRSASKSPVRVNIQREEWHRQSQSASIVEASEFSRSASGELRTSAQDRFEDSPPPPPRHDIAYRPKHLSDSTNAQEGNMPSGHNIHLRKSSGASPSNLDADGQEGMEEADLSSVSNEPVPQLQYHFQSTLPQEDLPRSQQYPINDPAQAGSSIDRYLTPNSVQGRTSLQRPISAYSELGNSRRSPGMSGQTSQSPGNRATSTNSGRSGDRPLSYIDLLNTSYPQPPPAPITFDNSQLRSNVGSNASLLSSQKTLDMYRQNVKKSNDSEAQYSFAILLIQAAREAGLNQEGSVSSRKPSPKLAKDSNGPYVESTPSTPQELLREARHILQKLSDRGYPFAQYYLADGYASGLFSKGKEDYATAFPLFISASKHGHAESGYRAALCYEFGWGCRKDPTKAIQFYRHSASKNHPGAMTRLGRAYLSGDLGMKQYREGLKWLKRASESADLQYNAAPYHLGLLYETGFGDDIFQDETYAAQLFTQAADLGHAEASYRLGDAYEHGKLACPRDPALSVHFYTGAAQRGHPAAMMALCAWYMVGAEPVLEKDENEAYEWARQAAECGLVKAEYAVGYFTEMGIGCRRDILEANVWYVKAADSGDERAKQRLAAIRAAAAGGTPMEVAEPRNGAKIKKVSKNAENDKDCVVM
ncbi:HCP-like protein [Coleophoma crateriformis]|uniref:HCP-like protein n=1 Tax=Coleophoma crateriformis TaxID=565419 RepID=A0A3D8RVV2_9HELO|nr:HCP-like protein [Coleophoma crateriformis]